MPELDAAAVPSATPAPPRLFGDSLLLLSLAGSQVLTSILNMLRAKGVAVLLGPSGVGAVSVVDQLAYVVAFTAILALPTAGAKYLSRADSEGTSALVGLYGLLFRTMLLVAIVVAVASSLAVAIWPGMLGEQLAPYAPGVVLALLAVPAVALHGLEISAFAALRRPRLASFARLGTTAGLTLGALAGMMVGGLSGLYAGSLVAAALAALALVIGAWRGLGLTVGGAIPTSREWRPHGEILRFCGVAYLVSIGEPVAFLLARYALLRSADFGDVGLFQSAYAVASSLGLLVLQSVAFYLMPLLNRHAPAHEKAAIALGFARIIAFWTAALALPLLLAPQLALALLFSEAFHGATPYLFLFVVDQALLLSAAVIQALLVGLDDLRAYLVASVVAQTVLAVLCWVLAPTYGLAGLAIAFLVAHAGLLLALLGRVMLTHRIALPGRTATAMVYTLVLLSGVGWLGRGELGTVGRVLLGLLSIVSLGLLLTGHELRALRHTVGRLWRVSVQPARG
jgi:PST family polysaccharide transporter